ncbi:MAG: hypothetical protein EXR08_08760 [Alphaproteobacteria bacterium]|nr:hypothetical protein [Alphaproteobacteria bacterium]
MQHPAFIIAAQSAIRGMMAYLEEDRVPVVRTDFKSDEACLTRLVGSTPALFRHFALNFPAADL